MDKYDLINILTVAGLVSWAAAAVIPLGWELRRIAQGLLSRGRHLSSDMTTMPVRRHHP